jgi:hypothetical protein
MSPPTESDDAQYDQPGSSGPRTTTTSPSTSRAPLFPASSQPFQKRPSHHKKRPASHIPRPPNAFILFRANFIRDRHLHTTTSGPLSNVSPTALSTIVGITWKNLPDEERQIWQEKARLAREEHKRQYPSYRYQPIPTAEERAINRESKRRVKEENIPKPDVDRCAEISRLLVEGHRGKDLEERLAEFDKVRAAAPPKPAAPHQPTRSSSLPTPPPRRVSQKRTRSLSVPDSPPRPVRSYPIRVQSHDAYQGHLFDSPFVSSPELRSFHDGFEPMPELTRDEASPSSIHLPDPDVSFAHQGHAHYSRLPPTPQALPQVLQPTPPLAVSTDHYTDSFSSVPAWNQGPQTSEPYYHNQFPYFTGASSEVSLAAANHLDPYASPIPPFELYQSLKSFEQPFDGFSTPTPHALYAFDNDYPCHA